MIYFHGNAEDVGLAMELLAFVKDMLKVSKFDLVYSKVTVFDDCDPKKEGTMRTG